MCMPGPGIGHTADAASIPVAGSGPAERAPPGPQEPGASGLDAPPRVAIKARAAGEQRYLADHPPLAALYEARQHLNRLLQPMVTMWRFSKSNGPTEGSHNKMEMMSRRAYGFRNFENYRLRVLTHCGWDGIMNRVRMDARPPLMG